MSGRHTHPAEMTGQMPVVTVDLVPTNPRGFPALTPAVLTEQAGAGAPGEEPAGETRPAPARALPGPRPKGHDGSVRNPLRAAEPKVRAASVAAVLAPIVLAVLRLYVPQVAAVAEQVPEELQAGIAAVITGVVTFVSGYLARAVDRFDLFHTEDSP
jgi:hypothetical protein